MPFKGSKNGIAEWVVDQLPYSPVFVDLFAGGCAITHRAMIIKKYPKYVINDIGDAPNLFLKAVHGELKNETRWISREEFERLKDTDTFIKYCFSFGNNGKDYLYGKYLEDWKKALHYARVFKDFSILENMDIHTDNASRIWVKANKDECRAKYIAWYKKNREQSLESLERLQRLQSLQSLQSLESLERLQSLESLESLERLQRLQLEYREVNIADATFYYADPPYRGTNAQYVKGFDFKVFDEWLATIDKPVIVSEYTAPKGTTEITHIKKRALADATGLAKDATERLFIQDRYVEWYEEQMQECRLFLDF